MMLIKMVAFFLMSLVATVSCSVSPVGKDLILHAPYTPFINNSVNLKVIPALAKQAAKSGVTCIWIGGSMGEFDAMSTSERKALTTAWVTAAKEENLYTITHVGSTVISDAMDMAKHAVEVGTDAIASVPPYYEIAHDEEEVLVILKAIAAAAPDTPFFYYHIPGMTKTDISVATLLELAKTSMPTLVGVKFVSTSMSDWMNLVTKYNNTHSLLFAPEPKLQSFAIGLGGGSVLAEDFFAPTFLRMRDFYKKHDYDGAMKEQEWKLSASSIFGQFGGMAAERAIYKELCGVDMGPPRPPNKPFNSSLRQELIDALNGIDFFEKIKLHGF
eukprot:m.337141 g.337141  ORF g.337141 m.337141 type:complete len:329 (+) comp18057_c0_seq1:31-1017(+)